MIQMRNDLFQALESQKETFFFLCFVFIYSNNRNGETTYEQLSIIDSILVLSLKLKRSVLQSATKCFLFCLIICLLSFMLIIHGYRP